MPNISISKMGFPENIYVWHTTNCGFVSPVIYCFIEHELKNRPYFLRTESSVSSAKDLLPGRLLLRCWRSL